MSDQPTNHPIEQPPGRVGRFWARLTRSTNRPPVDQPPTDQPTGPVDQPVPDATTNHAPVVPSTNRPPVHRPDVRRPAARPQATTVADWSTDRRGRIDAIADQANRLAADYRPTTNRPTAHQPAAPAPAGPAPMRLSWIRHVPPATALGTAYVLQTTAITDTVGEMLARTLAGSPAGLLAHHTWVGYAAALLLGLAVASCVEGGAAYVMELYLLHLLARDSVWILRLAMVAYVAGSGGAIHWWLDHRGLPTVISWLLAGMTASALFLYSRGARWRARVEMRAAGQLDGALPRLPAAAKLWHPIRALNLTRLVSWEPVATTDQARAVYAGWKTDRDRRAVAKQPAAGRSTDQPTAPVASTIDQPADQPSAPTTLPATNHPTGRVPQPADPTVDEPVDRQPAGPDRVDRVPEATAPDAAGTNRPDDRTDTNRTDQPDDRRLHVVGVRAAVANARLLRERYGDRLPDSVRKVRTDLKWSKVRADAAIAAYRADEDLKTTTSDKKRTAS